MSVLGTGLAQAVGSAASTERAAAKASDRQRAESTASTKRAQDRVDLGMAQVETGDAVDGSEKHPQDDGTPGRKKKRPAGHAEPTPVESPGKIHIDVKA